MVTHPDNNPRARPWLSWLDTLHAVTGDAAPTEEHLADCLRVCLQNEHWDAQPEDTDLYAFLALCWPYPALQLQIQEAMQYWSKERRALLAACVAPHRTQNGSAKLIEVRMSDVVPVDTQWLWEPYIPLGAITMLEGDPGNGKTFLTLAITSAIVRGYNLPDQEGFVSADVQENEPGTCLYISEEDSLGETIKKRYNAMEVSEADQANIIAIKGWSSGDEDHPFSFDVLDLLEASIERHQAKLIIIDPVTDFIGASVDLYRQNEVAPIIARINAIAQQHLCAFVLIRHWTKAIGASARSRGMGSVAFTQKARSMLIVGESPSYEGVKVLAHAKHNLTAAGASQTFSLANGVFGWAGIDDIDADTLAQQQPQKRRHQRDTAIKWLRETLQENDHSALSLFTVGDSLGYSKRTIERARAQLGKAIHIYKKNGASWWGFREASDLDLPY